MSIPDVLNQPWAITRSKFDLLCAVYDRHLAGEKLDSDGIRAAIGGDPRAQSQPSYTVQDGVAVIPVEGVLAKRMNMFTAISGGMSTQMLVETVNEAVADDTVHSLLLAVDSPGGEVDGTQQMADAIANSTKPTAAWVDGLCASAALWIASQCNTIYAASDTSAIGSMGVLVQHVDYSKADDAKGKIVTHITTGKYKVSGNSAKPLSQDDREYLQARVDYLYTLFLTAVAEGRGMDPQHLDDTAGDAQMFYAQEAVDNGLIDGIASEDKVISKLVAANQQRTQNPGATAPARNIAHVTAPTFNPNTRTGAVDMTTATAPFKTFATQADFDAHITATKQAGQAEAGVLPEHLVQAKANAEALDYSAKLRTYIGKVKMSEGRTVDAVTALKELQDLGEIPR